MMEVVKDNIQYSSIIHWNKATQFVLYLQILQPYNSSQLGTK
jgi:hypothetical protein